ncbi:MCE family protein [bacterium]|nr:MCE family protein [bacterium]
MISRSHKIRLGIFFAISLISFVVMIAVIVVPTLLENKDKYYVGYRNISLTGLQVGSSVKYHGLSVGHISDISIDPDDIQRVIVELSIDKGIPIKTDTRADITALGITGLKVIELLGGSNETEALVPGSFIQPGGSITEMITGKAEVIAEKVEMTLNNLAELTSEINRKKIVRVLDTTAESMHEMSEILKANKSSFGRTMENSERVTADLAMLLATTDSVMADIARIAGSDSLMQALANITEITESLKKAELVGLVKELNVALKHTSSVLKEVDISIMESRAELGMTVESLKESVEYLNQFVRMISEDPSVLVRGTKPIGAPDHRLER